MKIQRRKHFTAEVFTSSMNDIMFFLMLFFLIISTLANTNVIKVLLPNAQSTTKLTKTQVTLSITADRQYFIDKKPIPYQLLEEQLIRSTENSTDKVVVLNADATLTIQDLIDVLQIGAKHNIHMVMSASKSVE